MDDLRIVVSELVNNAVLHGSGNVSLRSQVEQGRVRLEVADEGREGRPGIRTRPADDTGGWGLRILDSVSLGWGVLGAHGVWAELSAH